jgi:hypothetical protein
MAACSNCPRGRRAEPQLVEKPPAGRRRPFAGNQLHGEADSAQAELGQEIQRRTGCPELIVVSTDAGSRWEREGKTGE